MKRFVKALLYRLGLGRAAERLYFNLKAATPRVIAREVALRTHRQEDQPIPPGSLIYEIIACRWAEVYLQSGRLLTDQLMEALARVGFTPGAVHKMLDFGCGCGRIARHLIQNTEAEIYGTDYNPNLVRWCQQNLLGGTFEQNDLGPPLRYGDGTFDLLIARSVFTHLAEAIQLRWIREFERIIRPGGFFYFTMHGPLLATGLSPEERARFDAGELIVIYDEAEGANLCSSYATRSFVERRFLDGFELVLYEPGRPQTHLRQDTYVLRRRRSQAAD